MRRNMHQQCIKPFILNGIVCWHRSSTKSLEEQTERRLNISDRFQFGANTNPDGRTQIIYQNSSIMYASCFGLCMDNFQKHKHKYKQPKCIGTMFEFNEIEINESRKKYTDTRAYLQTK